MEARTRRKADWARLTDDSVLEGDRIVLFDDTLEPLAFALPLDGDAQADALLAIGLGMDIHSLSL